MCARTSIKMGLPWLHPDEEVLCLYNILIWNIQIQRHTTMQLQKCKINKCAQRSAKQAFTAIRMGPHDSRWGGEVLRSLYWYEIYKYWYKYWYEICYTDLLIWNIQILIHIHWYKYWYEIYKYKDIQGKARVVRSLSLNADRYRANISSLLLFPEHNTQIQIMQNTNTQIQKHKNV